MVILNTLINYFFTAQDILRWAWRIPFLFCLLLAIPGYLFRRTLTETPVFKRLQTNNELVKNPILSTIQSQFREIIKVSFIVAFGGVINYLIIIFIPSYLSLSKQISFFQSTAYSCLALLVVVGFILFAGKLSDRYNKKYLLLSLILICFMLTWPLCNQLLSHNTHLIILTLLFFAIIEGCYFGIMMAYLGELFPARIRYTSLSFGYNLGFAIFAGLAPTCVSFLMLTLSPALSVSYLIFLSSIISMMGVLIS